MAEWIAPELAPEGSSRSAHTAWRVGFFALAGAAAAILLALCIFDASADMGLNGRPTIQRATAW